METKEAIIANGLHYIYIWFHSIFQYPNLEEKIIVYILVTFMYYEGE